MIYQNVKIMKNIKMKHQKIKDRIKILEHQLSNFSHLVAFQKRGYNTYEIPSKVRTRLERIYITEIKRKIKAEQNKMK